MQIFKSVRPEGLCPILFCARPVAFCTTVSCCMSYAHSVTISDGVFASSHWKLHSFDALLLAVRVVLSFFLSFRLSFACSFLLGFNILTS